MAAGANICPQGAVALDGIKQARATGIVKAKDSVVAVSTASALKFTAAGVAYHKARGAKRGSFANPYKVVPADLTKLESSLN
jgi:threonine synthase